MRSTLKSMLSAQYGVGIQQKVSRLSRLSLKLASAKNQMIFLERCKNRSLIPTFLKNRCPVRSKHARCISKRYQCDLLKETLYQVRRDFHKLSSEIKNIKDSIRTTLSEEHLNLVLRVVETSYEKSFAKHKNRLKDKFEKIESKQRKNKPPPSRPSLIKDPVLQLQQQPLPPEALSLLSLGTKFAVTPKEVPKMDIIEDVEKTCLSLERKGKTKEAETLRHETASILMKAKALRSNLTSDQKKGMAYLKKHKEDIAIVPFDKGEGFISIERKKLIEKSEKEFSNVKLDTKNTTQSHKTKIQGKLVN